MWFNSLEIDKYDFIVIDEAQDVFQEDLIDAIFLCLKEALNLVIGQYSLTQSIKVSMAGLTMIITIYSNTYHVYLSCFPLIANHTNIIEVASVHSGLDTMPAEDLRFLLKLKRGFIKLKRCKYRFSNKRMVIPRRTTRTS